MTSGVKELPSGIFQSTLVMAQRPAEVVMSLEEVRKILPHRSPMLFVDCVTKLNLEGGCLTAGFEVTLEHCIGHFSQKPVFPGNHTAEALQQAGGILLFKLHPEISEGSLGFLVKANGICWRKMVVPGDILRLEVHLVKYRHQLARFEGKAFVGDEEVASIEEWTVATAQ